MKTYHYGSGFRAGVTMTVKELREALSSYPDAMPVIAGWEGCDAFIAADGFSVHRVHKGNPEEGEDTLVIDVNKY